MSKILKDLNLDLDFYKNFYDDIHDLSSKNLIYHYLKYGRKQNRFINISDFYKKYPEFKIKNYKQNNNNLNFKNDIKYLAHYHFNLIKKSNNNQSTNNQSTNNQSTNNQPTNNQSTNNQPTNNQSTNLKFFELYPDFNLAFYKLHSDLNFSKDIDYFNHYHNYGKIENRIINLKSFNKLYPNFDIEFYKLHNDLIFKNDIEYFNHYHNYGRNELRLINKEFFYKLYPDFDLNYYKKFNNNLNFNNNINYLNHYYTYSNNHNNQYFKNDIDFTDTNFDKKLDNILMDKIYNHEYIRKIKTHSELINYYQKYQKKFFIYNEKSFYEIYSDFDLQFYKNKYFINTDKSDFDIMLYYHLHGKFNGDLINNKIKIIIYTAPFSNKCGGIVVLHYIAKLINEYNPNKYYAKLFILNNLRYNNIFCNNFASIDEVNDNTVVIYPEIVSGNPLNCKNVVRWILLALGIEMPIDHYKNWAKSDLIYHWEAKDPTLNKLTCHYINPIFYNNNYDRSTTCYLIKKGRLIHSNINYFHLNDSIDIENLSIEEISNIFNKSKYFYSYDPKSMYMIYALICGCVPIIYPLENITKEEYFKTTIFYKNGVIYNKGIAYGNSSEEITYAENTLIDGIIEIKLIFQDEINTVYNFLNNAKTIFFI
jgi:hypothetical protein